MKLIKTIITMKQFLTLAFIISVAFTSFGQNETVAVHKYSKIDNGVKYIISESVFADGHVENLITSVPLNTIKELRSIPNNTLANKNIEWDENANSEGLQITLANAEAIENAFNNALMKTETYRSYATGTFGRITLDTNFISLTDEDQTLILINKVIAAITYTNEIGELMTVNEMESYAALENVNKVANQYIFLSNGAHEIAYPHIQSIYNSMSADQYAGWYNRKLLVKAFQNANAGKLNGQYDINKIDDQLDVNELLNNIIANPTFEKAATVSVKLADPKINNQYSVQVIQDINKIDLASAIDE